MEASSTPWLSPGAEEPVALSAPPPSPERWLAPTPPAEERPRRRSTTRQKLSALGAAIVALLAKLKAILVLLPKVKLLATSGSMLVSVAAYALLFGWSFAV